MGGRSFHPSVPESATGGSAAGQDSQGGYTEKAYLKKTTPKQTKNPNEHQVLELYMSH